MPTITIAQGTVHKLPDDLRKSLLSSPKALSAWEDITPLARNEWICWTVTVKKTETRKDHVRRVREELIEGMRRPCCWIGCFHRTDKPISKSARWALDKSKLSK